MLSCTNSLYRVVLMFLDAETTLPRNVRLAYANVLRLNLEITCNSLIAHTLLHICFKQRDNPNLKGITVLSINKSFKSLILGALLTTAALVAGCGGGGATDPFAPGPSAPSLIINPGAITIYSGTPAVISISSGVGPFQAFSSDPLILPVTQSVAGAAVTLVANAVEADKPISITIQDGLLRRSVIAVTVKASPLLSSMQIIPAESTKCKNQTASGTTDLDNASFCSGETATARITVRTANTVPIANRQIRYDVVQGPYNFVTDQAGTVLAKTATIVSDQNGQSIVTIKSDAAVATQVALIRATDLVSGNRVDGSFTIVQSVDGTPSFNVSPSEATFTGYYDNQCGAGSIRFVIYGGTSPYTVVANSPAIAYPSLTDQLIFSTSVIVAKSGDFFYGITTGGLCAGSREGLFTITDAAGRIITAKVTSDKGSIPEPVAPPPTVLTVAPPTITLKGAACANVLLAFKVKGGTVPYRASSSVPSKVFVNNPAFTSSADLNVTTSATFVPGDSVAIPIGDSGTQIATATVACVP
jgi:hypothetical protein